MHHCISSYLGLCFWVCTLLSAVFGLSQHLTKMCIRFKCYMIPFLLLTLSEHLFFPELSWAAAAEKSDGESRICWLCNRNSELRETHCVVIHTRLLLLYERPLLYLWLYQLLKEKFVQKWNFSHYLLALVLNESCGKFHYPPNIVGASQQNRVAAFS